MSYAHEACCVNNIQTHVSLSRAYGFTGMQPHAYREPHTIWPGLGSKCALHVHGCPDGIGGAGKDHEEAISLRIDLVAVPAVEHGSQELAALRQYPSIALAKLLEQACGSLDIGEKERDGSGW
jgi:hypothetical protein